MITGFLVHDAHRVTETSIEAFIIRLFREVNRDGFVRGFSDDPIALSAGFHKMEHVLKHLYLRKAVLYPRFHAAVHACLQQQQPQVYEIEVGFTPLMKTIQEAIVVALATLKELQRNTKALDATELTMERALSKSFANLIRKQLDPLWHKLPLKTKQLVGDLTTLRQLLSYLTRYDAISYYSFLVNHHTVGGQQRVPSPWLFTEAADRLLKAAKARLHTMVHKETNTKFAAPNASGLPIKELTLQTVALELVLEENPTWEAFVEILDDIEATAEQQQQQRKGRPFVGGARVLVMVKDDRTCAQLREFLYLGGKTMMRKRFGHYLHQKGALMAKKGGAVGLEQQLLAETAKKYKIYDDVVDSSHQTSSSSNNSSKASSVGKKRGRNDPKHRAPQHNPRAVADRTEFDLTQSMDVASFGMSLDELEAIRCAVVALLSLGVSLGD